MRRQPLRIRKAEPIGDHTLRLTLTNGYVVERDIGRLLWGPVFEPLHDPAFFSLASAQDGTVVWPGEIDMAPETLIWGPEPPVDPDARPARLLVVERPVYN